MLSSNCPCCSNTLLRHIRSKEVYWFCNRCHQEMPNYDSILGIVKTNRQLRCDYPLTKSCVTARKNLILSYV